MFRLVGGQGGGEARGVGLQLCTEPRHGLRRILVDEQPRPQDHRIRAGHHELGVLRLDTAAAGDDIGDGAEGRAVGEGGGEHEAAVASRSGGLGRWQAAAGGRSPIP